MHFKQDSKEWIIVLLVGAVDFGHVCNYKQNWSKVERHIRKREIQTKWRKANLLLIWEINTINYLGRFSDERQHKNSILEEICLTPKVKVTLQIQNVVERLKKKPWSEFLFSERIWTHIIWLLRVLQL